MYSEEVETWYASCARPLRYMRDHRISLEMDEDLDELSVDEEVQEQSASSGSESSNADDDGSDDIDSSSGEDVSRDSPATIKYPRQQATVSQSDGHAHHLLSMLIWYSDYQASDARDHVYASLRLAHSLPGDIHPDYGKSVHEVFLDVVKAVIGQTQSLSTLYNTVESDEWYDMRPASWPTWAHRVL